MKFYIWEWFYLHTQMVWYQLTIQDNCSWISVVNLFILRNLYIKSVSLLAWVYVYAFTIFLISIYISQWYNLLYFLQFGVSFTFPFNILCIYEFYWYAQQNRSWFLKKYSVCSMSLIFDSDTFFLLISLNLSYLFKFSE